MVKRAACAAPTSSSGLLPGVSPYRLKNVYGWFFIAWLSVETAPLPSRRLPLQVADPKRFMVFASLLAEFDLRRLRRLGAPMTGRAGLCVRLCPAASSISRVMTCGWQSGDIGLDPVTA